MVLYKLASNIRFYILLLSVLLISAIYIYVDQTKGSETAEIIEFTQLYALTTLSFLYLTILITPLLEFFPQLPFKTSLLKARRALGVSAFLFALFHSYYAFFGELGGFEGLKFLNLTYLTAATLGLASLLILSLLTFISVDFVVLKIKPGLLSWLRKSAYIAIVLVVIHALMLGSHFSELSAVIPQIFLAALTLLLLLEGLRFDNFLNRRFNNLPKVGISFLLVSLLVFFVYLNSLFPGGIGRGLSVHESHKQMIENSQNQMSELMKNMPGMQGDKTKRFTVDADIPENILPGVPTNLKFRVFDASNGAPVIFFTVTYEKLMHMIVVDSSLNSYQHIHPEFKGNWFELPVTFPKEGRYHIYLDFVPTGAIEQQVAFTVNVGNTNNIGKPSQQIDQLLSKQFGDYKVDLKFNAPLRAKELTAGAQFLDFELSDKDNKPVTTLKPYLGSFGHMIMINTQTYEYLHVHPLQKGDLLPGQNGGPQVRFIPMGLYAPIKLGIYKVFAQFNPDNNLITSDFVVKVE